MSTWLLTRGVGTDGLLTGNQKQVSAELPTREQEQVSAGLGLQTGNQEQVLAGLPNGKQE